jgi:2-polyprenyl-3-methyl-5-hydroxy-6-metoxy-1,4-benzoquinol methylase
VQAVFFVPMLDRSRYNPAAMQANEAAWYDAHYQQIQTAEWVCWYKFSLPYLRSILNPQTKLVELGCGQGPLLRYLAREKLLPEENIYGMDQSRTAVDFVKAALPNAHVDTGDIYRLPYSKGFFDVCLLMETIEHLEEPGPALAQILSVMKSGGVLLVSYPNFARTDWRIFRWLAETLKRPQWVVLQPIDKIYRVSQVIQIVEEAGFEFEHGIGSGYGIPFFFRYLGDWPAKFLNALGLWRFSFHPILVFRKPPQASPTVPR